MAMRETAHDLPVDILLRAHCLRDETLTVVANMVTKRQLNKDPMN
jgi:hypothetical protein